MDIHCIFVTLYFIIRDEKNYVESHGGIYILGEPSIYFYFFE